MQLAQRLDSIETSAIRELFKLLGQPGIISFAGGFPDAKLFDTQGIQSASQQVLQTHALSALQYGATEGYGLLREHIATHLRQHPRGGAQVQTEQLIITTGSQQALDLIGKTLINPGDKVLVEAPTFLAAIQCFRLYGANLINAPIDEHGVQTDALEDLIVAQRPKLIYLIPTFGNPSGCLLNAQRRKQVLELAVKHQVLVIEDDPYGELYFSDTPPPPSLLSMCQEVPNSQDWLLHCGSFSKTLAPGLRIGWLVAAEKYLSKATMCKQFSDACTSTLAQAVACEYLGLGRLTAHLQSVRQVYARRAKTLCTALQNSLDEKIVFSEPPGGMFVWARLPGIDVKALAQKALEHKVAFVPGHAFYATNPDPSTIRLSFATSDEATIIQGVERLAKALS